MRHLGEGWGGAGRRVGVRGFTEEQTCPCNDSLRGPAAPLLRPCSNACVAPVPALTAAAPSFL